MKQVPFTSTEKAWFWAIAVHEFKLNPKGPEPRWPKVDRPCEYADILRDATRLGLCQMGIKVMVKYGRKGKPPTRTAPENEQRLWSEGMDRLGIRLRAKGIVAAAMDWDGAERSA